MIIHFNTVASNFRNCYLADETVSPTVLQLRGSLSAQSGSLFRYVRLNEFMLHRSGVCTGQVRFSVIIIIIKISVRAFCIFVPGISYVAYVSSITTILDKTTM